jgi:peptidoglycan/LPS O-acetylase OafA/YrhL
MLPQHDAFLAQRFFGSPDGWRCMSILGVVWHHCHGRLELGNVGRFGFLGVAMFFVLSGFLIMTLLLREQSEAGRISLPSFYARRSLRIMPLYYGVVLVTALVVLTFGTELAAQAMRRDLPYLLTYTTNWVYVGTFLAISWSLSAEEQFYLVAPAIQKFARHAVWIFVALAVLNELIAFRVLDRPLAMIGIGPMDLFTLRTTGFTPIILGVLLAHTLNSPRGFRTFSRLFGYRVAPLVLAVALLACLEFVPWDDRGWVKLLVFLLMTVLIGSTVVREDHALAPFLSWRPIARIGVISYGMYLLHLPVQMVVDLPVQRFGWSDVVRFFLIAAGTMGAAQLTYRFYETPFLKLKRRFARRGDTRRAAATREAAAR